MKQHLSFLLIVYSVCAQAAIAQSSSEVTTQTEIIRVHTALDHVTVIEFGEPVSMVAAGSPAFHIERQQDKVLVEPVKAGVSTDLFVWTATRRFNYELEPAGEVAKMSVAIDSSVPKPKPVVTSDEQMQRIADSVLTQALLGAQPIENKNLKIPNDGVLVRVQNVFRTKNTVYVHYRVENYTQHPFRVSTPKVYELQIGHASISLASLVCTQLSDKALDKLGRTTSVALPLALAQSDGQDVAPGVHRQGVVAIRQDLNSPKVLRLEFDPAVKATLVF